MVHTFPSGLKTGCKPFPHSIHTARRFHVTASFLEDLGLAPKASLPYGEMVEQKMHSTDWLGMLGNGPDPDNPVQELEGVGDCVECDDLRALYAWSVLGAGPVIKPTTADAYAAYSAISGFNSADPNSDQGTDTVANDQYFEHTGIMGQKLDGWGIVDYENQQHELWAIQIACGVRYCIQVPDFAEDQFASGVWDYTGQSYQIMGGHDVRVIQYTRTLQGHIERHALTWGKRILITPAFAAKFCTAIQMEVSKDFITATGSAINKFDLHGMLGALSMIANVNPTP